MWHRVLILCTVAVLLGLSTGCSKQDQRSGIAPSNGGVSQGSQAGGIYYGDPTRVGELKNAVLYFMRNEQWQDVETTMRVIIDSNQKHGDTKALVNNYCVLGLALKMQGKHRQELFVYEQELQLAKTLSPSDPASECDAFLNMASAQVMLQRLSDARKSLEEARQVAQQNNLRKELEAVDEASRFIKGQASPPSQSQSSDSEEGQGNSAGMDRARQTVKLLKQRFAGNPALNLCAMALNQPDFMGVIQEEGCVVTVDENGTPLRGITTRAFDYDRRLRVHTRPLTEQELSAASSSVEAYYETLVTKAKTIVILSHSFRRAASEAILNMAQGKEYFLKREGKEAQLFRKQNENAELIAAEAIFYE